MGKLKGCFLSIVLVALVFPAHAERSPFSYCDVPLDLPQPPAEGLELVQAQLVVRHGDRIPSMQLPVGTVPWECEPFAHALLYLDSGPQMVSEVLGGPFSFPPSCYGSQLTAKGRDQQLALGAAARAKYVEKLKLLPAVLSPANQDQVYFRSTDEPRTRQSGQAFLIGLYPTSHRIANPVLPMHLHDLDSMAINPTECPRLEQIYSTDYPQSEYFQRMVEENLEITRSVGLAIGTWNVGKDPNTLKQEIATSFMSTCLASDNLYCRVCHDKPLPEGVDLDDVEAMRPVSDQYLSGFSNFDHPNPEAARLSIGLFLKEIRQTMEAAQNGDPSPLLALYSGHDMTLWPLLATLVANNDVTVPYASHLAFELWRDPEGEPWVSVDFNGDYLTVGDCESTLCPLAQFLETTQKYVPVDYDVECRIVPTPKSPAP